MASPATRLNFSEIAALLESGEKLSVSNRIQGRVVERGIDKRAPFHGNRNSVADAVLIETYAELFDSVRDRDTFIFATSNY
jgi:hypothetical protein